MGYGIQKEAADITIRVPSGLRDDLNSMKDLMRAETPHEVIRKLINYRTENEMKKVEVAREQREFRDRLEKEKADLKSHQAKYMLDLGTDEGKEIFTKIKEDLGLQTDIALLEFLVECYRGTLQLPIGAFELYIKLKGKGA